MADKTCLVCFEPCLDLEELDDDDDIMEAPKTLGCCGCTLHRSCYYNMGLHHNAACPKCRTPIEEFCDTSESVYDTSVALANLLPLRRRLAELRSLLESVDDRERLSAIVRGHTARNPQMYAMERDAVMLLCYLYFAGE